MRVKVVIQENFFRNDTQYLHWSTIQNIIESHGKKKPHKFMNITSWHEFSKISKDFQCKIQILLMDHDNAILITWATIIYS